MKTAKFKKKNTYKPIFENIPQWPVYQFSKNKKKFLEEVFRESIAHIKTLRPTQKQLIYEIETTIYREQNRMKHRKWRVDPVDEKTFWDNIKSDLLNLTTKHTAKTINEDTILRVIVQRYAKEISADFKPIFFRFVKTITRFWFARLLNSSRVKKINTIFKHKYTKQDKIYPVGEIEALRKLTKQGTVVMVPTHFSNLDSIVIGWINDLMGLPPFIYGAGLNLFNMRLFAYLMSGMGVYKIDRRKKNLLYIETLKMYSNLALQSGAHSLFFPGGTRSKSGSIETRLQLGLLSTPIEAQQNILLKRKQNGENTFQKIFIVPVTFNYPFVLEAPNIIRDYLHKKGEHRYLTEREKYGTYQLIKFLFNFFTKGSSISVSIGHGLDVLGNYVDEEGNSLDRRGRIINIEDYFISNGQIQADKQRIKEYTHTLSQRIIEEYHRIGYMYASHVVAFVAFKIWEKKYHQCDLFNLLRMPEEGMSIEYDEFKMVLNRVRKQIYILEKEKKVNCDTHLKENLDEVIKYGLNNVGVFHLNRPLLIDKKKRIVTQDITTLYYYHNRLSNYGLEKFI